ncbi:endonuclease/exonuclease/phosphatase family protein [Falsiroseomonas oryzae]|uniref:endonuclease/exonuclease/phosphatase family protein n=1 Tax=Falsiroseomonas oryzae TaxID=2766473 RepID=UPI0022EB31BF|nr:endonuclease/exonuclease/phosphatase family protein [Roseomonas sp. MO-31]
MRVATYNAHRGRDSFGRFGPERIAGVIAEIAPDLIALQEAQHWLRPGRGMFDAAAIEAATGLRPLDVTGRVGEQGWRGNVVLVRREARLLRPPVGLRLGGWEPRGGVLAELDLGVGPFRVVATHLSLSGGRRRLQAAAILAALRSGPPMPTLLLGDLNEWRPAGSALAVLAELFGTPRPAPTFPAFQPRLSLDRIMGYPPGLVGDLAVHDSPLARRASDHLPLTARVEPRGLPGAGLPG